MEFRKVFDTIPEQFDKYRPRYSEKLFAELVSYWNLVQEQVRLQNQF